MEQRSCGCSHLWHSAPPGMAVGCCELRLRSTPRYRLVCNCFPDPGRGLPYGSGLGLSRCLGPGECLHSFIHIIIYHITIHALMRVHAHACIMHECIYAIRVVPSPVCMHHASRGTGRLRWEWEEGNQAISHVSLTRCVSCGRGYQAGCRVPGRKAHRPSLQLSSTRRDVLRDCRHTDC